MRVLSNDALDALDSGRFRVRCLLYVDMPDNDFAIWDDLGSITVAGITYAGAPGRFTVAQTTSSSDLSTRGCDVVLSGLDTAAANDVESEAWHQRPILISRAVLAESAPQIVHVLPVFAGFLDQLVRKEAGGGQSVLTFKCEASARELSRKGARTRSDADQRKRDATDGFFKHVVSTVNTPISWGTVKVEPQTMQQPPRKLFGIF